jgi:sortase A
MFQKFWKRSRTVHVALWLMLVAGVGLIALPEIDEHMQEQKQNDLLTAWVDQKIPESREAPAVWKVIDGMPVLGTITIDKIGLHEPMVRGAGADALKLGIGVVEEDRMPGESVNFVLAGHRSFTYGLHFNRLPELERGDTVVLEVADGTFTYTVETAYLVKPDDLSVLDSRPGVSELTLITCQPMRNPTHRLIVKAALHQTRRNHVAAEDHK